MKRIAVFQSNLKVGGIQRSLTALLSVLGGRSDISVDLFLSEEGDAFFELPSFDNIRVFYPGDLPYVTRFVFFEPLLRICRRGMRRRLRDAAGDSLPEYDASIDFDTYRMSTAVGALSVDSKKYICWVHNNVLIKYGSEWKYRILHFFFRSKYRHFDKMAMVSRGVVEPFYSLNKNGPQSHAVVNNALDIGALTGGIVTAHAVTCASAEERRGTRAVTCASAEYDPESPVCAGMPGSLHDTDFKAAYGEQVRIEIVSMGHLIYQKGFDELLEHIKRVARTRTDREIHFTIIGDGPDRKKLMEQAREVEGYVTFAGYLKDPFKVMREADAFVSCSRYEGQPLSLVEARALGLPVIIPKTLEPYTDGLIEGAEDVTEAILGVKKRSDHSVDIGWAAGYNERVIEAFYSLIDL